MRLTLALGQGLDYFAQTAQAQVDCFEFKQVLLIHDVLLVDLLASRQITQVEFTAHEHAPSVRLVRLDQKLKDSMRST